MGWSKGRRVETLKRSERELRYGEFQGLAHSVIIVWFNAKEGETIIQLLVIHTDCWWAS